jgi:hypothetical protein
VTVAQDQRRRGAETFKGNKPPPKVRRRSDFWGHLACVGLIIVGAALLGLYMFVRSRGTPSEADLTLLEGLPSDIQHSELHEGYGHVEYFIKFKMGSWSMQYGSSDPNAKEVFEAVHSGMPIRVWVLTNPPALVKNPDAAVLYQMEFQGKLVMDVQTRVAKDQERQQAFLIIGSALILLGGGILTWSLLRRRTQKPG